MLAAPESTSEGSLLLGNARRLPGVDLAGLFEQQLGLPGPGEPLDRTILPGGGGVCALTDEADTLILTLATENIRRTVWHRLNPPGEPGRRPRTDLRAVARRLWWTPTYSVFETSLVYLRLARRLAPGRYRQDLAFGPVWFARVNPADPCPHWVADTFAFTPPTVDVGPFRDRDSCRRFIELLEDTFDLCRHHEVLRLAPSGQACAYHEMGKCSAPCDGSITLEEYRRTITASVEFAIGHSDTKLAQMEAEMRAAADRLQFERAAQIRQHLSRVRKHLASDGRLHLVPDAFRYLVIQRGGGTSRVKPFFIDRGHVMVGEPVQLGGLETITGKWADKMQQQTPDTSLSHSVERSECLWLVSHFLIKGDKAPGLFLHAAEVSAPSYLADRVRSRFSKRDQPESCSADPVDLEGPLELK